MDGFGVGGYGGDATRDFFLNPDPYSSANPYRPGDGSRGHASHSSAPPLNFGRLDLNSNGFPYSGGFQGFFQDIPEPGGPSRFGGAASSGYGARGGGAYRPPAGGAAYDADGGGCYGPPVGCGYGAAEGYAPNSTAPGGGAAGGAAGGDVRAPCGRGAGGSATCGRGRGSRGRGGVPVRRILRNVAGHAAAGSSRGGQFEDVESDDDSEDDNSEDMFEVNMKRWMEMDLDAQRRLNAQLPVAVYGMIHDLHHYNKTARVRGPESGEDFVQRLLVDPYYCFTNLRMSPELFTSLHTVLVDSYGLTSSDKSSSLEALSMFLWMVATPCPFRQAMTKFERSLDTVHRNFHKVLKALDKLGGDIIKPKDPQFQNIHPRLQESRFKGLFNNCIGAIDGTHIKVIMPTNKVVQYLNQKGWTSQNVLAVVDFDLRFTFVLTGWPGSVHDMRVFNDAMEKYGDKFPHPPPGKYYLWDSGYPNKRGYLAPYRETKYHLQEYRLGIMPRGIKETFNFAHSSLRNALERAFGILKQKWRILKEIASFPFKIQSKIIVACMALQNFLIQNGYHDADMDMDEDSPVYAANGSDESEGAGHEAGDADMNAFRDHIAHALYYN